MTTHSTHTAEQIDREMLDEMGYPAAFCLTAGDVVPLANIIADRDRLSARVAELEAALEACLLSGYRQPDRRRAAAHYTDMALMQEMREALAEALPFMELAATGTIPLFNQRFDVIHATERICAVLAKFDGGTR